MRITTTHAAQLLLAAFLVMHVGCNGQPTNNVDPPVEMSGPPPEDDGPHEHDEHQGAHGGQVIELGRSHEFHAEIVEDETTRAVTVYVLGQDLQQQPIDAQTIKLSLVIDSRPQTFELAAHGAEEGKAARFQSTDAQLFAALHEGRASGKLLVTINGKSYSGDIAPHDHRDHAGHDH